MRSFNLLIDFEVVILIEGLPKALRAMLRARLGEIRDHSAQRSDYFEHDTVGRRVEINICGSFAIKFWIDHADQQIKVLDIHPADRRR